MAETPVHGTERHAVHVKPVITFVGPLGRAAKRALRDFERHVAPERAGALHRVEYRPGLRRQRRLQLHELLRAIHELVRVQHHTPVAIAGLVVQIGLGSPLAALRVRRCEVCPELIVGGRQGLPLACIDRARRRLRHPRTWERLATSIYEVLQIAARPLPRHPA